MAIATCAVVGSEVGPPGVASRRARHLAAWARLLLVLVGAGVVLVVPGTTWGQGRPELPEFTGERVLVGPGVPDRARYEALNDQIERLERSSDQSYYVVVIRDAGDGPHAAVNAIDALYDSWTRQVRRQGERFDPDRSVLVLMGLDNRQISVRPGRVLQERYDLTASTLDREIVQPEFVPLARRGDFVEGLASLLEAIDDWIARRDGQVADRRRLAEQRAAQVRADAEAALAEASRLRDEARRELDRAREAGIGVGDVAGQVDRAASRLPTLQGRLDADPADVLGEARQAQQELRQVVGAVRQRVAQLAEATTRLDALPGRVRAVDEAIGAALREDLPVGGARDELAGAQDRIDAARDALPADPAAALERLGEAERRLESIRSHLAELPELMGQRRSLAEQVAPLAGEVAGALERAGRSGVDVAGMRARLDPVLAAVAGATGPEIVDPRRDVAALQGALGPLRAARGEIEAAVTRRRFATRTLPLGLGLGVLVVGLIALALVRWKHVRTYRTVDDRFREFRTRAVAVMERLDALKERYKLLPVLDKDFRAPMTGATLELYDTLKAKLDGLWDRWLAMMEAVEQAQQLIGSRSALGTARLREAEALLERGELFDEVRAHEQEVAADLDRLNQAHEHADALRNDLDQQLAALRAGLEALATADLDPAPFATDQAAIAALHRRGTDLLTPDPLSARSAFEEATRRVGAIRERIEALRARREEAEAVSSAIDEVRTLVGQHRNAGLKLEEDDANPDAPLSQARAAHGRAIGALRAGDPDAAARELEAASALVDQARQAIDRTLAARDACRRDLPDRSREARNLLARLDTAAIDHQALVADFAPSSWQDVAGHLDGARKRIEGFEAQLQWATGAASDSAQRYVEASRALDQVARQQQEAAGLMDAIRARLEALRRDRDEGRTASRTLAEKVRQTAQRVETNAAIVGNAAREALADAVRRVESADRAMSTARPDWADIRANQAEAEEDLAIAGERIEADLQAYDQLRQRLRQARTRRDQVDQLLRSEDKDRPPVNNRFKRASEAIRQIEADARSGQGDWQALLTRLDDALADLDRTEQIAREDVQLANRAIAEITEAHRGLRSAQGEFAMGVSPDLRGAESELHRARAALQAQDYEQAIELANAAEASARAARSAAADEARRRRDRLEAERRRRNAAEAHRHGTPPGVSLPDLAGMAAVIIGNAMSQSARSSSTSRPDRSPSRPRSPSSSTSWSPSPRRPDSPSSHTSW